MAIGFELQPGMPDWPVPPAPPKPRVALPPGVPLTPLMPLPKPLPKTTELSWGAGGVVPAMPLEVGLK